MTKSMFEEQKKDGADVITNPDHYKLCTQVIIELMGSGDGKDVTPTEVWNNSPDLRDIYKFTAVQKAVRTIKANMGKKAQHEAGKSNYNDTSTGKFLNSACGTIDQLIEQESKSKLPAAFDLKKTINTSDAKLSVKKNMYHGFEECNLPPFHDMLVWKPAYLAYEFSKKDGRNCIGFAINLAAGTDTKQVKIRATGTVLHISAPFPKELYSEEYYMSAYSRNEIKNDEDLHLMMIGKRQKLHHLYGDDDKLEENTVIIDLPFPVIDTKNPEKFKFAKNNKTGYLVMEFYLLSAVDASKKLTYTSQTPREMTFSQSPEK